jgi:hypothetical protein
MKTNETITSNVDFRNIDDALAYIKGQARQITDDERNIEVCMGSGIVQGKREFYVYFKVI